MAQRAVRSALLRQDSKSICFGFIPSHGFPSAFRAGIVSYASLWALSRCSQPTVGGSCEEVAARLPVALRVATCAVD